MTRTYDFYICEICGFRRPRPTMCPYCKLELVEAADARDLEITPFGFVNETEKTPQSKKTFR